MEVKWRNYLSSIASDPSVESGDIFKRLCKKVDDDIASTTANNMKDVKLIRVAKQRKGIFFEQLCEDLLKRGFLLSNANIVNVYRFANIPDDIRKYLRFYGNGGKLSKRDTGIDIVAEGKDGKWYAIQCKYLMRPTKVIRTPTGYPRAFKVSLTALSTFYSLCMATGPDDGKRLGNWEKYIVITSADGIQHQGAKHPKKMTIASGTLSKLPRDVWTQLCGFKGHSLIEEDETSSSNDKSDSKDEISTTNTLFTNNTMKNKISSEGLLMNSSNMMVARNAFLDRLSMK